MSSRLSALTLGTLSIVIGLAVAAQGDETPRAIDFPGLGPAGTLVELKVEEAASPQLRGRDARRQLVVTGKYSTGQLHDFTQKAAYSVAPAGIVQVDKDGFVTPLKSGAAEVKATADGWDGRDPIRAFDALGA